MKLSITQVALGVLIACAAGYIMWWMLFDVVPLLAEKVPDAGGVMVQDYTPRHEILFTVARYASILLTGLGLLVLSAGALRGKIKNQKRLAVTQIIAGALIIALSAFILIWGYSFNVIVALKGGPVLTMTSAKAFTVLTSLMGLVVLITGIFQFIKSRKTQNI